MEQIINSSNLDLYQGLKINHAKCLSTVGIINFYKLVSLEETKDNCVYIHWVTYITRSKIFYYFTG